MANPLGQVAENLVDRIRQHLGLSDQGRVETFCGRVCLQGGLGCASVTAGIALFVIACIAASGAISPTTLGGCAIGLGGGALFLSLASFVSHPNLQSKGTSPLGRILVRTMNSGRDWRILAIKAVTATAVVTLGILALAGVLPSSTAGYAIFGTQIGGLLTGCYAGFIIATKSTVQNTKELMELARQAQEAARLRNQV